MKIELGKKYQTREGKPVRIHAVDHGLRQPVIGVRENGTLSTWHLNGAFLYDSSMTCGSDLVEVPAAPQSVKVYAAAAGGSHIFGVPEYVTSTDRDRIENHGKRRGPVVEVELPLNPPKPPVRCVTAVEVVQTPVGRRLHVQFGVNAERYFAVPDDVALGKFEPKTEGIEWHTTPPPVGQWLLIDTELCSPTRAELRYPPIRGYKVGILKPSGAWYSAFARQYFRMNVKRWARINLENES